MSDSNSPSVVRLSETAPQAQFDWNPTPFETFLERNFKLLLTIAVTAAVGGAGWLVWRQQHHRNRLAQAQAFTSAESLDDYKKVITSFPGTEAAGSAHYMSANLLAQNNDTAGALKEWQDFTKNFPSHPLVEQAELRVALLTIETGETQKGVEQLEAFLAKYPQSPFRGLAQLRQGDALVSLGEKDKAVAIYTQMTEGGNLATTSGKPARDEALQRLEWVKLTPPTEIEFVPEPAASSDPSAATLPATLDVNAPSLNLDAPEPTDAEPILPETPTSETAPASEDTTSATE